MNISALIIARNEERIIEDTLKSLSFVDEIVVVLDRSIDGTQKICKKYTTKIFCGSWVCEGQRRNYGIRKCSSEWVLEIDADKERISLGIKQLEKDPFSEAVKDKIKIGKIVTCLIDNVLDTGLEVTVDENLSGFIKRTGLSRDKDGQKSSSSSSYGPTAHVDQPCGW